MSTNNLLLMDDDAEALDESEMPPRMRWPQTTAPKRPIPRPPSALPADYSGGGYDAKPSGVVDFSSPAGGGGGGGSASGIAPRLRRCRQICGAAASALSAIELSLVLIATITPHWFQVSDDINMGIWTVCYTSTNYCGALNETFVDTESLNFLQIMRACMIIASFAAAFSLLLAIGLGSARCKPHWGLAPQVIAAIATIIAFSVAVQYHNKFTNNGDGDYALSLCWYFTLAVCALALLNVGLLLGARRLEVRALPVQVAVSMQTVPLLAFVDD
ncbi:hypothetical protein CAOG_06518 [Capsaspora owczarzaki ATCC 30864]|uniref:Uncharacterized protein n=1 Tax=Capsaspora owczarzaki (strain ATCC 30864) TaxID=595528 RepID=A0A0D2X4J2_CAPO3|nr:hypothetical protein CAOG_06518 [Capsaspora owczarzaki ATCC 30864]KJE96154.1 hypothetical protein, variant [Capsaspora owczarzaki ATCC 30864]|eukprot:XP_004345267.2 hypothetical protein CAOG_06518 [Capsaspora owczarzaki ATCC 30864]